MGDPIPSEEPGLNPNEGQSTLPSSVVEPESPTTPDNLTETPEEARYRLEAEDNERRRLAYENKRLELGSVYAGRIDGLLERANAVDPKFRKGLFAVGSTGHSGSSGKGSDYISVNQSRHDDYDAPSYFIDRWRTMTDYKSPPGPLTGEYELTEVPPGAIMADYVFIDAHGDDKRPRLRPKGTPAIEIVEQFLTGKKPESVGEFTRATRDADRVIGVVEGKIAAAERLQSAAASPTEAVQTQ
jgi:hypothetical protein